MPWHREGKGEEGPAREEASDLVEVPLTGGRTTQGVVWSGDTVRRPASAHSPFVRQLLLHLEDVGFDGAPRFLGVDERGRDILTFLHGDVPPDLGYWELEVLDAAARLIRKYHDATAGSALAASHEVVCHNDLSPCNAVFVDGMPRYLIDFDAAKPGDRVRDLAYACWLWLDLGNDEIEPERQRERLAGFLQAYGWSDSSALVSAMIARQGELRQDAQARGWQATAEWADRCRRWVERHRAILVKLA